MRIITCAICKTNDNTEVLYDETIEFNKIDSDVFSARRMPDRIHYRLLRCKTCGLIISSPILSEKEIKKLYRDSKVTYDKEIDSLKETYGRYLQKAMTYVRKDPHVLEIGAGNGFFLEKVKDMGITKFVGIEPGKPSVDQARADIKKLLIVDFFPSKKIKPGTIDIICVFQTLDHIIDLNSFLRSCYTALRKGGVVLCIHHDTEGLSVRLLQERSPIFDIEHIYLFNKQNLPKVFEMNKFTSLEVMTVKNTFPLRYWTRMFPLPLFLKQVIISGMKTIGIDSLPITLSAGNLGIIAQKK